MSQIVPELGARGTICPWNWDWCDAIPYAGRHTGNADLMNRDFRRCTHEKAPADVGQGFFLR